jgi:hypothetical protein
MRRMRLSDTLIGKAGIALPTDGMSLRRQRKPHLGYLFRKSADLHQEAPGTGGRMESLGSKEMPPIELGHKHKAYKLSKDEMGMCQDIFPESRLKWILPVPSGESDAERAVRRRLEGSRKLWLRGVPYYVFEDKHGFASASKAARVRDALHVWFEPRTDYSVVEEGDVTLKIVLSKEQPPGSKPGRKEGLRGIVWDEPYVTYVLSEIEERIVSNAMGERELMWMAPVPEEAKRDPVAMGNRYGWRSLFQLNEKIYHVFGGEEGDQHAKRLVKLGNVLHIWYDETTDYELLGQGPEKKAVSREVPVKLGDGAITMLTDRCSLLMKAGGKPRLMVMHGKSYCREMIEVDRGLAPGKSRLIITDLGYEITLMRGKDGSMSARWEERPVHPRTDKLGQYSHPEDAWTVHGHEEASWEFIFRGGYRLEAVARSYRPGNPGGIEEGYMTYMLTNDNIPGYARLFALGFGNDKREEKHLLLGEKTLFTVAADAKGTWVVVAEMDPHKRFNS